MPRVTVGTLNKTNCIKDLVSIYWRLEFSGAGGNNMNLNDELGSFSKRREVEVVAKKRKSHDEDDYEYDDWDDDEYDDSDDDDDSYGDYDFKMYELDELEAFNEEQRELDELISPWWKNLRTIFKKSTFSKIGMMEYKRKSLLSDDTFKDVYIDNIEESLEELKIFGKRVEKNYFRRFTSDIFWIVLYVLLASWTGWNTIWYFLLGWPSVAMVKHYLKYAKDKKWLQKAETFITTQDENMEEHKRESEENTLEDVLAFNAFISKEENNHWSIKLYDSIANLFTRKK